jgi:hypothetical protein
MRIGNESSVSTYHKDVAQWDGVIETYRAHNTNQILENLNFFVDTTDEVVDGILDREPSDDRIYDAGARYRLSHFAGLLIESIEAYASIDEEWREAYGDED